MASLEYVMARWLRSRKLTVASFGGWPGLWRLALSALAPSGRRIGAREPFAGWRALG